MGKTLPYTASRIEYFLLDTQSPQRIPKTFEGSPVVPITRLSEIIGYELERPEEFRGAFGIGRSDEAFYADLDAYGPGEEPQQFTEFNAAYESAVGSKIRSYQNKTYPLFERKQAKEESKRFARSA